MRIYCSLQLRFKKANCRAATIVESLQRVKTTEWEAENGLEEELETHKDEDQGKRNRRLREKKKLQGEGNS